MKRGTETSTVAEIEGIAARWVARRDAGLSPAEECELKRWVDADPRHSTALAFYDSAWSALSKPSQSGAGAELEQQLITLASRRRWRRFATGGAAAVVLLGISIVTWNYPRHASELATPNAIVLTPVQRKLPDGSIVELNGNAKIVVDYSASLRRVRLREGEAHFAVQKDSSRPFVVSAGGVEVRAVGTAFSVLLGSTSVDVLVTDGRVAVNRSAGPTTVELPSAAPLATVPAGNRVVVDLAPSFTIPEVRSVLPAEVSERLAWRSSRLEFTRAPLAEAVMLLNQHAPSLAARLVIADSTVAAIRVSGVFRADNTDAFVLLMEGAFGVKAERSGNTIVLRKVSAERASK